MSALFGGRGSSAEVVPKSSPNTGKRKSANKCQFVDDSSTATSKRQAIGTATTFHIEGPEPTIVGVVQYGGAFDKERDIFCLFIECSPK